MINKNYKATDLINICELLEGKKVDSWDYTYHNLNGLKNRLSNLIGLNFSLFGEEFRNKLYKDIKDLMFIDKDGRIQYKEF